MDGNGLCHSLVLPHHCLPRSVDPFTKKDWYEVKAPATFQTRNIGQTLVTRTQGKSTFIVHLSIDEYTWPSILIFSELASDGLKGRVFEVAQADLQGDEVAHRKFRLISEDVQGKHVLTNFHGMSLTSDKIKSLVKKWQVS